MVMEDGGLDLKTFLDNAKDILYSEAHAKKLIYQLLCSVNFLHSAGVIHRDLKPENILVDENFNLKLCDLGLARCHSCTVSNLNLMSNNRTIGHTLSQTKEERHARPRRLSNHVVSRSYRPPEIILLETEYDGSIDLWAAGCISGEILGSSEDYDNMNMRDRAFF